MLDETVLRENARHAIHHGRLPRSRPDHTTWVGSGDGETCEVCCETVSRDQRGMEVTFKHAGLLIQLSLHTECFSAWECERVEDERSVRIFAERVVGILVSRHRIAG